MATLYKFNITNNSTQTQGFFLFQKPAEYVGGPKVFSNSIYHSQLRPFAQSGSILTVNLLQQYFAGVQTQPKPPVVGQPSGTTTAIQAIEITPDPITPPPPTNSTDMLVDPLGLTPPTPEEGVQSGAFRITTPEFDPRLDQYNAGLGVQLDDGSQPLSNFISAQPQVNIDCQPVVVFHIQVGNYLAGDVINFTSSAVGSADCDATSGVLTFNVEYTVSGGWVVNGERKDGLTQLI